MARRVSFATTTTTNRLPVADDAWGNNEYLAQDPPAPPPVAAAAAAAPPAPRPPPPLPPPTPLPHAHQQRFPTLRALCLTSLAQHLFLLADVAAASEDDNDPDVLRRSLPCADDRLALAAAARRRGELSSSLFAALADPSWPVLSIGSQQPSAHAVTEAAQRGLLKGLRRIEWVLPSEVVAMAVATPPTPTTATAVLLPSEAASVVRSLAAHCESLEELILSRSEPARPTRPAVAAAVAKAVLAAALPKGLLPVARRRQPGDEGEDDESEAKQQQQAAAPDSWEDALAPADQKQAQNTKTATIAFAPSLRLLRWEDLPDAAADAIAERCPRISLDRRRMMTATIRKAITDLDAPWLSLLAPNWDDRAALLQEKREEERARREAARGKGLPLPLVPSDDHDEEEEDRDAASTKPKNDAREDDDDSNEEDDSLAARFRRAYAERARRLKQVERAKEAQRRRREVRASPALRVVERWLDEPV